MHDPAWTPGQGHDAFCHHAGWVYGVVAARCDSCVQALQSELARHDAGDGSAGWRSEARSYAVLSAGPAHGSEEVLFFQAWPVAGADDEQVLAPDGQESCSMALPAEEQARVWLFFVAAVCDGWSWRALRALRLFQPPQALREGSVEELQPTGKILSGSDHVLSY